MTPKSGSRLAPLVDAVLANYQTNAAAIPIDCTTMPDRESVIHLTRLLLELLYPGYIRARKPTDAISPYHIGALIEEIQYLLAQQIARALCSRHRDRHLSCNEQAKKTTLECEQPADDLSWTFLSALPNIRSVLATDVQAAYDGDPAASSLDEIVSSYPGVLAISIYRLAHELYGLKVPLMPRIMTEYAHSVTGIDIHPGAEIGGYFFIDHGTGVVIGETTVIGERVKIYQGVTLGALSLKEGQGLKGMKRHPTLESDVVVYSGASILGGETVMGTGSTVGGNSFITGSVPAHTTVSVKNPELRYKSGEKKDLDQPYIPDWVI